MSATIRDVAKLSGLSLGTISKYINGQDIKDDNRIKIEQAIKQLNFRPNSIAKGLRTSKSFIVAILVPALTSVFCTIIISAVEKYLITKGYFVIVCECQENEVSELQMSEFLINRMVDGIILLPFSSDGKQVDYIKKHNIPLVLIDRIIEGHPTDGVILDNISASYTPVEKMIQMGHRKIGLINGNISIFTCKGRLEGYLQALDAYSIPYNEEYIRDGNFTMQGGRNAILELWALPEPPTAVLITNYDMTIGAFIAVNQLKLNIPDDISIIGFDNLPLADIITPKLSLIVQPIEKIGLEAAKLLYQRMQGDTKDFPTVVTLTSETFIEASIKDLNSST